MKIIYFNYGHFDECHWTWQICKPDFSTNLISSFIVIGCYAKTKQSSFTLHDTLCRFHMGGWMDYVFSRRKKGN